jgi:hypothetical protein
MTINVLKYQDRKMNGWRAFIALKISMSYVMLAVVLYQTIPGIANCLKIVMIALNFVIKILSHKVFLCHKIIK